ncbi:MAG TPA: hypothetical protein VNE61_02005 [Ktedonobacteraceae bacterium]|nr:hypothetical protein [Ktedonobacteraceae bacterium]
MQFLEADETSFLHSILASHMLIASETARSDMLINCGLASLLTSLSSLEGATVLFVNELCARLSQAHVVAQLSGQPALVALLNYLSLPPYDIDLSPAEKRFLERVKQQCLRWYASQMQQQAVTQQLLTQESQREQLPSSTRALQVIDREQLIVNYDLYTLMAEFANRVNYGTAAAFTVGGDFSLQRGYVIERMRRCLQESIPGNYAWLEMSFDTYDSAEGNDALLNKVIARNGCQTLADLFNKNPGMHIVLVVWCYAIPPAQMGITASHLWQGVEESVLPLLEAQNRCFVLILANVETGGEPFHIDKFTPLPLPSEFDVSSLSHWLQGRLEHLAIEKSDIEYCLERLRDQRGDVTRTYHELEYIVSYLQERYS